MNRFRGMQVKTLLTSHYPIYTGAGVAEFLAESRAYVDRVDQAVIDELAGAATPPTMRDLCTTLGPKLGEWPDSASIFLAYPLQGHLERLVQYGVVATGRRDGLMTYRLK